MKKFFVIIAALLSIFLCSPNLMADTIKTDFVFIVDATGSMSNKIATVKTGLSNFVDGLNDADIDFRFSLVLFGGAPELVLDWTTDKSATETAFNSISTGGAVSGFQINHNVNPEAGLEAIRIVLGGAVNNTLLRDNVGGSGGLTFRNDARKNLILVTDEDSDRPFYLENRTGVQITASADILSPAMTPDSQTEIDNTAQAVIDNNAFLNMLIYDQDGLSEDQYGDPDQDESDDDFSNFDPDQTLENLQNAGFGESLEAQILAAGLIGRTFDIGDINTENFINNFFNAKIAETIENPVDHTVPEPATMILFGLGLLGIVSMNRRKK